MGKLINDPKGHDDLVKLLGNLERNKAFKRLIRWSLEMDEKHDSGRPE
jgi:hypothetical protein